MKTTIIKCENINLIQTLERLQYELDAHKDLLTWCISNDINSSSKDQYQKEYTDLYIQYEKTKKQFEKECVRPAFDESVKLVSWSLDFQNQEVTVTYND